MVAVPRPCLKEDLQTVSPRKPHAVLASLPWNRLFHALCGNPTPPLRAPRDRHQGWLGGAGGLTVIPNSTHNHHKEWLAKSLAQVLRYYSNKSVRQLYSGALFLAFQFSDEKTGLERGRDLPKAMKQVEGGSEAQ